MTKKERDFAKALGACAGKWVATDDKHVVACGKTIKEVREQAKRKHVEKPRIFAIPDPKKGNLFY